MEKDNVIDFNEIRKRIGEPMPTITKQKNPLFESLIGTFLPTPDEINQSVKKENKLPNTPFKPKNNTKDICEVITISDKQAQEAEDFINSVISKDDNKGK